MGYKHRGRGFCRYEGEYKNGDFQGDGTYRCIDGREYHGQWRDGKRCGIGTMVMCPVAERGDHTRRYVGGLAGLYRPIKYAGTWVDDQRMGLGTLTMADGM